MILLNFKSYKQLKGKPGQKNINISRVETSENKTLITSDDIAI